MAKLHQLIYSYSAIMPFDRHCLKNGDEVELQVPAPNIELPEGSYLVALGFEFDPYVERHLFVKAHVGGLAPDRTFGRWISAPLMAKIPLSMKMDAHSRIKLTVRAECRPHETVETLCGLRVKMCIPTAALP